MPCAVLFLINTTLGGKRPQLPIRPVGPRGRSGVGSGPDPAAATGAEGQQRTPPPREGVLQPLLRPLPFARGAPSRLLGLHGDSNTRTVPRGARVLVWSPSPPGDPRSRSPGLS